MSKRFPLPRTMPPPMWYNKLMWTILRVTWDRITKKDVHWFHWVNYQGPILVSFTEEGDPNEHQRGTILETIRGADFAQTAFCFEREDGSQEGYIKGFSTVIRGKQVQQICTVILIGRAATCSMAHRTDHFALDLNGKPVKLRMLGERIQLKHFSGDVLLV